MSAADAAREKALLVLIDATLESAAGYRLATDRTMNPSLGRLFSQRAGCREAQATRLRAELRETGGTPAESSTAPMVAEPGSGEAELSRSGDDLASITQLVIVEAQARNRFDAVFAAMQAAGFGMNDSQAVDNAYASLRADQDKLQDLLRTMQAPESVVDTYPVPRTFAEPKDVLADRELGIAEKRVLLEEWRDDAMQLADAESEGMVGGPDTKLRRVNDALLELERQTGIEAVHKQKNVTATA